MAIVIAEELEREIASAITAGTFFSNPYPLFQRLRESAPVHHSPTIGGWLLTRHSDVDAVLRDPTTFSSKGRVLYLLDQLPGDVQSEVSLLRHHFATGLAHSDAPEHRRLRGLLARAFTPKMVENLRPATAALAENLIQRTPESWDLIENLLTPLPAMVVGSLLGSAESDIPDLIRWAHAINGLYEKGGRISAERALHAEQLLREMRDFVRDLVEQRRTAARTGALDPEADVLSGLVAAEADEGALTEDELLSTAVTLFVAGHETTTHLLGNGLAAVLSVPELWERMTTDASLIPAVVEEMARFDGSVPRSWRIATVDTQIDGVAIPAGALVLPLLAAANRDPAVFSDPDRFDPARDTKRHLAYGKGFHVCLGAPLARVEGQEVLLALARMRPQLRLAQPLSTLTWRQDMALRGLVSLPVTTRP